MKRILDSIWLCLFTIVILSASSLSRSQTIIPARVSVNSSGQESENPYTNEVSISADGKYAVFTSLANNLAPGDNNYCTDIFRRNLVTGVIEPVSISAKGVWANGTSWYPSLSSDGRFVTFTSGANNLDPNLSPSSTSAYVKDMVTGACELVSVASGRKLIHNWAGVSSVSDDGRFVAFQSIASDVVPNDTNNNWIYSFMTE